MPDYFRGRWQDPSQPGTPQFVKEVTQWPRLKLDWEERILPYARRNGARTFCAMGTCWGSYLVLRLSGGYGDLFRAGVSLHPAHSNIILALGEREEEVLEAAKNVPQVS